MNITTSIGEIRFHANNGTQVYLCCRDHGDNRRVTVRGVQYYASVHLSLVDGQWQLSHYSNLYVSRDGSKPVSDAAKKTILEAFKAALVDFIAANPDVLPQAEKAARAREIERMEEQIKEATEELLVKQRELNDKKRELEALKA